jgi:hypothetical protein
MNDKIQDNLKPLYSCYAQYKMLFDYYQDNRTIRSKEEIKERIEYLKKNPKINQRTELECLLWLLGEVE